MKNEIELRNPYVGLSTDEGTGVKLVAVAGVDDVGLLRHLLPTRGATQIIINLFIKSLADQLRAEGINYYKPEYRERLNEIIRSRCTITEPTGPVSEGHE